MKTITYKKEFSRDFSVIMEEAWFFALSNGLSDYLGYKKSQKGAIPLVIYSHDGLIEVWKNQREHNSLIKKITKTAKKNPEFLLIILNNYENKLAIIQKIFKGPKIKTSEDLRKFIDQIFEIMVLYALMYYMSAYRIGNRKLLVRAAKLRDKDSFYDDCDCFLRENLLSVYPQYCNLEHLIKLSELNNPPVKSALEKRYKNFILIPGIVSKVKKLGDFIVKGSRLIFVEPKVAVHDTTVKGQSAFLGKISGRVKIIFNKRQIKDFKKGEILVMPMTTPNYVSIMKKAAAFVTDEGGITCHAAILARELRKPCVIGTKIATKVFKDGDLVEVDADKGVVNILKRK